jgi:PIN domain nuclease of toxin-antitoxin system
MNQLADTQSYLWFVKGEIRLPKRFRSLIEDRDNQTFVSVCSLWEIAIKSSLRKLELNGTFTELVEDQVEEYGFHLLPITREHLIEFERLPYHHRDPFDRLIIAQAIAEGLPVITTDPKFKLYDIECI